MPTVSTHGLDNAHPVKKSFTSIESGEVITPVGSITLSAALEWYLCRMPVALKMQILSDYIAFQAALLTEENK